MFAEVLATSFAIFGFLVTLLKIEVCKSVVRFAISISREMIFMKIYEEKHATGTIPCACFIGNAYCFLSQKHCLKGYELRGC